MKGRRYVPPLEMRLSRHRLLGADGACSSHNALIQLLHRFEQSDEWPNEFEQREQHSTGLALVVRVPIVALEFNANAYNPEGKLQGQKLFLAAWHRRC